MQTFPKYTAPARIGDCFTDYDNIEMIVSAISPQGEIIALGFNLYAGDEMRTTLFANQEMFAKFLLYDAQKPEFGHWIDYNGHYPHLAKKAREKAMLSLRTNRTVNNTADTNRGYEILKILEQAHKEQ